MPGEIEPVAAQIEVAVALTRLPHHRGVDDRQQLRQVVAHQIVEEHRVVLLQLAQQQMLVKRTLHGADQSVDPAPLLGEGLLLMRHAAAYTLTLAFCIGQAGAHHDVVHFVCSSIRYQANREIRAVARISITAPPRREEIWAKGISFIRWAAESTATSPVPPMLAIQSPPVMAASMG